MVKVAYYKGNLYYEGQDVSRYNDYGVFLDTINILKLTPHKNKKTGEYYLNVFFTRKGKSEKFRMELEFLDRQVKNKNILLTKNNCYDNNYYSLERKKSINGTVNLQKDNKWQG